MLELSGKDFNVIMKKMLQQAIMNMLETRGNVSLRKKTKDTKNNQIENLELKITIIEIQSSMDRLNSRTKETEESISVREGRTTENTQSEKTVKIHWEN